MREILERSMSNHASPLTEWIPDEIIHSLIVELARLTNDSVELLDCEDPQQGAPITLHDRPVAKLKMNSEMALRDEMARLLSHICNVADELRERTESMTALAQLSTLLTGRRETQLVLDTIVRSVTDLLGAKASAIRLLDENGRNLQVVAVHNLSSIYQNKGSILLTKSRIDQQAFEDGIVYIPEMTQDSRILYPQDAKREGLVSLICVGLVYRGRPIGVLRIYTGAMREFTQGEINLLRGIGQLAAAFIRNAQLDAQQIQQIRIQRQIELAADVQRRLMPAAPPNIHPFEVFGRYEPCFELGGDFFDFLRVGDALGVMVGDVVGKGIAAGLLMASVRTGMRAHAEDRYDIDKVMEKVNLGLVRDTLDNEFATVFYGTFDTQSKRLGYCSAGHEPGLLFREGRFTILDQGGLPLGIDAEHNYEKGLVQLRTGDVLFFYTDGVTDASNFEGVRFGRERVKKAIAESANGGGTARDIVNHVLWETRRFVGLNHRPDDMTLVAVRVN